MTPTPYREAKRVHTSILAAAEKRCLVWMAQRLPAWMNSDHLTALAGLAISRRGHLLLDRAGALVGDVRGDRDAWR